MWSDSCGACGNNQMVSFGDDVAPAVKFGGDEGARGGSVIVGGWVHRVSVSERGRVGFVVSVCGDAVAYSRV